MNINKNQLLNQLYCDWIQENPKYKGIFKKDGIINETEYNKTKIKILFIAKEANDKEVQKSGDFRQWMNDKFKYLYSIRLGEWAFGIINDFPDFASISKDDRKKALRSAAFMNLKKSGGGSIVCYKNIEDCLRNESALIRKEIKIINPEIIVGCFSCKSWRKYFLPEIICKEKPIDGISIGKWENARVIDFFHPSYRGSSAMSYALLRNVVSTMNKN